MRLVRPGGRPARRRRGRAAPGRAAERRHRGRRRRGRRSSASSPSATGVAVALTAGADRAAAHVGRRSGCSCSSACRSRCGCAAAGRAAEPPRRRAAGARGRRRRAWRPTSSAGCACSRASAASTPASRATARASRAVAGRHAGRRAGRGGVRGRRGARRAAWRSPRVALVGGRLAAQGDISIGELIAAVGVTQFLVGPLVRLAWVGGCSPGPARPRSGWPGARRAARGRRAGRRPPRRSGPSGARPCAGSRHGPLAGSISTCRGRRVHGVVATDPAAAAALLAASGARPTPDAGRIAVGGVERCRARPRAARARGLVARTRRRCSPGPSRPTSPRRRGRPGAVERALAAAAVDDVIAALPDGAATRLADGGRSLSGGQRQRIALARALAAPAPVLVLHEPTTALDAATEARVAGGAARGPAAARRACSSPRARRCSPRATRSRSSATGARPLEARTPSCSTPTPRYRAAVLG